MDLREKLAELIGDAPVWQNATMGEACTQIADYLIANGVTVQEWIPVNEPPEKEGWYHVAILDIKTGKYSIENDLYAIEIAEAHGHQPGFCKARRWEEREKLTHWFPYPEPPKGD